MSTLDAEQLKTFAREMSKACGAPIISDSELGLFRNIVKRAIEKKLGSFSSLLPSVRPCCFPIFGKPVIVLPFVIGSKSYSLDYQMDVIIHEAQHAFDIREYLEKYKEEKGIHWLKNYFASENFRCWAEGTPCTAESEVGYFLTNGYKVPVISPSSYVLLGTQGIRLFNAGVEQRASAVIEQDEGWIPTQESARVAIRLLRGFGINGKGTGATAEV